MFDYASPYFRCGATCSEVFSTELISVEALLEFSAGIRLDWWFLTSGKGSFELIYGRFSKQVIESFHARRNAPYFIQIACKGRANTGLLSFTVEQISGSNSPEMTTGSATRCRLSL